MTLEENKTKNRTGLLGKARLAKVFLDAVLFQRDLNTISASRIEKLKMRLKERHNAAALYPELLQQRQFVFFGDTNHTDVRIHKFFYSSDNIDRMAQAGIRHVFPEMEPALQPLADQLISGSIDQESFASSAFSVLKKNKAQEISLENPSHRRLHEMFMAMAEGFTLMDQKGMKIHCVDDRSNLDADAIQNAMKIIGDIEQHIFQKAGYPAILHGKSFLNWVIHNSQKIKKLGGKNFIGELITTRLNDDFALAQRIKNAAGDQQAAILFGAGHTQGKNSLYDCLGKERTVHIDVHSTMDLYADRLFITLRKGKIPANFVHILDQNALYKFRGFE